MITEIENAIVDRLRVGLGGMAQEVKSYGGELDGGAWARTIGRVPAVWVAYGGAKVSTKNLAHALYEQAATFTVMCATRSLRDEQAGRQGGASIKEIGSNDLIYAVLRLLAGQKLAGRLNSFGLIPERVRVILKNAYVANGALSVIAIEFKAGWSFAALPDGRFPEQVTDEQDPDYIFAKFGAQLSAADAEFNTITALILDDKSGAHIGNNLEMRDK